MKKIFIVMVALGMVFSFPACGSGKNAVDTSVTPKDERQYSSNSLIVYFSLRGNSVSDKAVDASTSASIMVGRKGPIGTTEHIAGMIQDTVGGDIHLIQTMEPYPDDFNAVIERNHDEINKNYLPPLKTSNLNVEQYDTVFIGYPVWATTVPQAILSFLSENNLSGKTIIPFCTHDGYGSGRSYAAIQKVCPDTSMLEGIAIEAKDVPAAKTMVLSWLNSIGFSQTATTDNGESIIMITIGDIILDGVMYDTPLALEIKAMFPLTVSMVGFGGREYYGIISQRPVNSGKPQRNFINGDITYCAQNNSLAIFYAQTDRPNLGMDVTPIGKVTSALAVFDTLDSRVNITFSLRQNGD
jgi:flavodoxin